MRATILLKAIILTKTHSIMAKECIMVYNGLSTASEVLLIFTTQPYSYLCNYNAMFSYTDKREVLQQEYSQPPILPFPHFRWVVNARRRVSSVVEHSSANPKVPGSIPGPVSYWGQGL